MEAKRQFTVSAESKKCVGCLVCQMRCSYRFTKSFCPTVSLVNIDWHIDSHSYKISFSDKCDSCGLCARICPYGAIKIERN